MPAIAARSNRAGDAQQGGVATEHTREKKSAPVPLAIRARHAAHSRAMRPPLTSPRLRYRELGAGDADAFHALVTDAHVRRYLLDGEVLPRSWCEAAIATSVASFAAQGVGLWMIWETGSAAATQPIGFCGYWVFEEVEPAAQLLYAFVASATGRGYATETARALVDYARAHASMADIVSAVDAPNTASARVLEKLGFERRGAVPGAFGDVLLFVLRER
jgi:[ribosomal protein S5]-alanine N-acetyltransferase